jgi:pSer/pThr/pTyr-binding forkhead associated (FHA) protein
MLGTEAVALPPGSYILGGRAADALRLGALASHPAVASIIVTSEGRTLIRRTTAAVVVRVDGEPLGIAAAELHHGAIVDFNSLRLTYDQSASHQPAAASDDQHVGTYPVDSMPSSAARLVTSGIGGRLVDVRTGRTFALAERRIVLGRDESCDVVITGTGISRRHASISPCVGGYLIRDESSNGTIVNGAALAGTYKLVHGDIVQLAEEQLRFDADQGDDVASVVPDDDATQLLDLSHITRGLTLKSSRHVSCTLEVVRGALTGTVYELDKPVCTIGRAAQNDVKLRDDSVSSAHATLLRKGDVWYVVDLRSANGTFVDGSRTAGERELVTGTHLRVGAVDMIFRALRDGVDEPDARPARKGIRHWLASRLWARPTAMAS